MNAINEIESFLQEELKLKHKGKNKLAVTLGNKEYIENDLDGLISKVIVSLGLFKNNPRWQKCKTAVNESLGGSPSYEEFEEKRNELLKEACSNLLKAKNKKISEIDAKNGSAFNCFYKELTGLSNKTDFNEVDMKILEEIRYCSFNKYIYILHNGQLTMIDSFERIQNKSWINHLCAELRRHMGQLWNEGNDFGISDYVRICIENANNRKREIIRKIGNETETRWEDIEIALETPESETPEYFKPSNFSTADNANRAEEAADAYCVDYLINVLPGSLLATKSIILKSKYTTYEKAMDNSTETFKQTVWNEYFYDIIGSGKALTEPSYLENIFKAYPHKIQDLEKFQLPNEPTLYTDDDSIDALNHFSLKKLNENLKGVECYKELEQCKNLMLLKSWMKPEEFKFCMAWIYSTIFPSKSNSNIALLLWTGGGTGKSSMVQMVKYAIALGTGTTPDKLYFEIKGGTFDKDDKRDWAPDGEAGITKSVLINVDEATTKSIELYKDFSGSADRNTLSIRQNYRDAETFDMTGHRFIFTTNKGLQLNSDDGSLLRRIALIKHSDIKNNISAEGLSNDEIVLEYKKQIPMMIAVGKKCTEDILAEGFKSIDEYSMKTEAIASNLKESTATSNNTIIYEEIWNRIEYWGNKEQDSSKPSFLSGNEARLQGGALKWLYNEVTNDLGEDSKYFGAFKNFIKENPSLFEKPCENKQCVNYMKVNEQTREPTTIHGNCNHIWKLYRLKKPVE